MRLRKKKLVKLKQWHLLGSTSPFSCQQGWTRLNAGVRQWSRGSGERFQSHFSSGAPPPRLHSSISLLILLSKTSPSGALLELTNELRGWNRLIGVFWRSGGLTHLTKTGLMKLWDSAFPQEDEILFLALV